MAMVYPRFAAISRRAKTNRRSRQQERCETKRLLRRQRFGEFEDQRVEAFRFIDKQGVPGIPEDFHLSA